MIVHCTPISLSISADVSPVWAPLPPLQQSYIHKTITAATVARTTVHKTSGKEYKGYDT
jgi:hypothetical protein